MQRTPEPEELMDDADQAQAYAEADFAAANTLFIEQFHQLCPQPFAGRVLDLGCGPGDIPLALAAANPEMVIDALDGSTAMLQLAEQAIGRNREPGSRIHLVCETLPCDDLPQQRYDAVVSNSLLHHLRDPMDLWRTIGQTARTNAAIVVMDLARPASPVAVDALVESYAIDEPEVLRRDFRNSLFAAYTPAEVADQVGKAGLELQVAMVSDRHWAAVGHWTPGDRI